MTLSTVWAVLRRWLLPLIVISLAAGAIVAAWALNQPVQYSARTEMIVGEVNQSADSTRASTQLIGTYADLIVNEQALTAMFRQIIANNRAGGWRRLKRDGPAPMA